MLRILVPKNEGIYGIAAEEFAAIWRKATGKTLAVTTKDDRKSDLVVMGFRCGQRLHARQDHRKSHSAV